MVVIGFRPYQERRTVRVADEVDVTTKSNTISGFAPVASLVAGLLAFNLSHFSAKIREKHRAHRRGERVRCVKNLKACE